MNRWDRQQGASFCWRTRLIWERTGLQLRSQIKSYILLVFVFEKQHRNMNFPQVSSLLRACLRADEQITQRNKLELDISTNEEDIGGFLKQSKILIFLQMNWRITWRRLDMSWLSLRGSLKTSAGSRNGFRRNSRKYEVGRSEIESRKCGEIENCIGNYTEQERNARQDWTRPCYLLIKNRNS